MRKKLELIGSGMRWMGQWLKPHWGEKATGANPTDRGKSGSKRVMVQTCGFGSKIVLQSGKVFN